MENPVSETMKFVSLLLFVLACIFVVVDFCLTTARAKRIGKAINGIKKDGPFWVCNWISGQGIVCLRSDFEISLSQYAPLRPWEKIRVQVIPGFTFANGLDRNSLYDGDSTDLNKLKHELVRYRTGFSVEEIVRHARPEDGGGDVGVLMRMFVREDPRLMVPFVSIGGNNSVGLAQANLYPKRGLEAVEAYLVRGEPLPPTHPPIV